jgi:hypothetical protein
MQQRPNGQKSMNGQIYINKADISPADIHTRGKIYAAIPA